MKRKHFLYFRKRNPALFSRNLRNKSAPGNFILQETETPKKLLMFQEKRTWTKNFIFLKTELSEFEKCEKPTAKMFSML